MIELLQSLGHAATLLRRGNHDRQLRYSFLFNSLGVLKKQKRKRNSQGAWHGLIPLPFQEVDVVLFLIGAMPSNKIPLYSGLTFITALTIPGSYLSSHTCRCLEDNLVHPVVTSD